MSFLDSAVYPFFVQRMPYLTILVFAGGMFLRVQRWWQGAPNGHGGRRLHPVASLKYFLLDVVLFRKTFRRNKGDWLLVFAFHGSVGAILFGHMRGFHLWSASMLGFLGEGWVEFMVHTLPIYMGWILIVSSLLLLVRRVRLEGRQLESLADDYLALTLVLAAAVVGQGMRLFPAVGGQVGPVDVVFIPRLIVLHLESPPSYHWFHWHVFLTQLFVIYTPFSKFIHILTGALSPMFYGSRRRELGLG